MMGSRGGSEDPQILSLQVVALRAIIDLVALAKDPKVMEAHLAKLDAASKALDASVQAAADVSEANRIKETANAELAKKLQAHADELAERERAISVREAGSAKSLEHLTQREQALTQRSEALAARQLQLDHMVRSHQQEHTAEMAALDRRCDEVDRGRAKLDEEKARLAEAQADAEKVKAEYTEKLAAMKSLMAGD